jgi:S-adenosyl methyltransferase
MTTESTSDPGFDTSVAHIARVYNYWLGGTDYFPADQAAAEQAMAAYPDIVLSARANRAFLRRAVHYLAGQAGIRQFLDIGTGIPSANNTHEVAQAAAPESRVVYVDKDPVVLAQARMLLMARPGGSTDYIDADLRQTAAILDGARRTLDFSQPVAVMLMAMLQHIGDEDEPYAVVRELLAAVPAGSYLVLSHPARDIEPEKLAEMGARLNQMMAEKVTLRGRDEAAAFFDGLELVEPGLVNAPDWRPETAEEAASPAALWCGVARKP